ncbi:MAG TPA: phage holin family protein [Chryseosolibacter sp.]|nr:phage holin family protein [Chryseosolibacter sp.]
MFKDTFSKFFKIDSLLSNLTGYVEARVDLLKVEVKEDLTKALAQAVAYLFIAFIFALFLTFVSIAVALLLSASLGRFAGFSIVGGVYLIIGSILWLSREKLISKLETRFALLFRKKK